MKREKVISSCLDDRLLARMLEWNKTLDSVKDYESCPSEEIARQIGRNPNGFHSSWLKILQKHSSPKKEILKHTVGTAMSYYCEGFEPCETVESGV